MTADQTSDILAEIEGFTDVYFKKSRQIVDRFGDKPVTYAVFMRRPVVSAPRITIDWLNEAAASRGVRFDIDLTAAEGEWVGAGEPIMYLSGPLLHLIDLETIFLQKLGAACVAAYNALEMCRTLPNVEFLAMDARHCAGIDMAKLMAYAASVGSNAAVERYGAKGFVGNATDGTSQYFRAGRGLGTMPHGLIGYAGSTLRAAEMYHDVFPSDRLTVLVDYFGREKTDALEVAHAFPDLAAAGRLAVRLDTHGGRYLEGLDTQTSYAVLDRHVPDAIRQFRTEAELNYLVGPGVSAAAVWFMRDALDEAGFEHVKIVVSSGFSPDKCKVFAMAEAPADIIGTGSFLPNRWGDTYATADIIEYDGQQRVKVGREFLIRQRQAMARGLSK